MGRGYSETTIIGNLGADVELRYTQSGVAVANFRVAVNQSRKNAQGEYEDQVEWFRVVAWDKLAENANTYLKQGSKVFVKGAIQTRKYTDKEGIERTSFELVCRELLFLDSKTDSQGDGGGDDRRGFSKQPAYDNTRQPQAAQAPRKTYAKQDFDDDQVPFD